MKQSYVLIDEEYLAHHGILGQKWGIRRFQPYPKNWKGVDGNYVGKRSKRKEKRIEKKMLKKIEKKAVKAESRKGHNVGAGLRRTFSSSSSKEVKKVAESGNTSSVAAFSKFMKKDQLNYANARVKFESSIAKMSNRKRKKAIKSFNKYLKSQKKQKLKANYENGAKIYNEAMKMFA